MKTITGNTPVRFIDDPEVVSCIVAASEAATTKICELFSELTGDESASLAANLQKQLRQLLTEHTPDYSLLALSQDAFGDPFDLANLPLARPGTGYAVQKLDTDTLLDRQTGKFLPVRNPQLSGLFASFSEAFDAAKNWLKINSADHTNHSIAIVPAHFDDKLHRHVLIYGVLTQLP